MRRLRTLVMAGVVSALAITALGAPAAATHGKGTIAVVNGIPGQKVDICINGKEIKSRVRYGGKVFKTMNAGRKVLKVFKKDPRKCKGVKLSRKAFTLVANDTASAKADLTLVVTKKAPKIIIFDNIGLGRVPPTGLYYKPVYLAWRHAADIGGVNIYSSLALHFPENPVEPAVNAIWRKGDQRTLNHSPDYSFQLRATWPGKTRTIARSSRDVIMEAGRRYEWYLVGTTARNAKFVVFSRAVEVYP